MKVIFVSFEVRGIYKTGGLGDVAASLPTAVKKTGVNVSILMPGYNEIIKPRFLPQTKIPMIYIKEEKYFDLTKKYSHGENFERFFYFCQKAVEIIKKEKPDIIHLNDWHTGMIAYLMKIKDINQKSRPKTDRPLDEKIKDINQNSKILKDINNKEQKLPKIILTIHNAAFQGDFSLDHVDDFKNKKTKEDFLKLKIKASRINFLKLGIDYADFVTTVSKNYAKEMIYQDLGYGLKKNLVNKGRNFVGILNGIDYNVCNPQTDKLIEANYQITNNNKHLTENKKQLFNWQEGKNLNKVVIQRKLKLPVNPSIPLIAFVARLSWQKGIEKIIEGLKELAKMDLQLIVLGKGDKFYEEKLKKLKERYEDRFLAVRLKFDEKLAHQIYAGSDMFLIPSRYEPCGLTQMIAMRYGTIPVARKTGGLVDSIKDGETGLLFGDDTTTPMLRAIKKAIGMYYNWIDWKQINRSEHQQNRLNNKFFQWPEMVERAMKEDFSWEKSAEKYLKIYEHLIKKQ